MFDLVIAGGIVVLALVIFVVWRMGVLPSKSIPVVAGALLGALGLTIFKARQADALRKRAKELEDQIKAREETIAKLRVKYTDSDEELTASLAELAKQKAAIEQEIVRLRGEAEKAKQEALARPTEETFDRMRGL